MLFDYPALSFPIHEKQEFENIANIEAVQINKGSVCISWLCQCQPALTYVGLFSSF